MVLTKKPRTSRKIARKNYLKVAKKRRPSQKERRKAIGQQLGYIQRNLGYIDQLIELGAEEVSRQQREMWSEKKTRVDQRIVSLSQPHVRPIVRGKAPPLPPPTSGGARGGRKALGVLCR